MPTLPSTLPAGAPPAFHLLSKPTGAICNLDCAYCFFLAKEMLYPGSRFRMADELLENLPPPVDRGASHAGSHHCLAGRRADLDGSGFFRRSIEHAQQYARPGMTIQHTIQTNGTLIDDEWAAFFKQTQLPRRHQHRRAARAMHDVYRQDKGGAPTFDKVMRGLSFLKQHGVEWNALVTLNHANVDHPVEVYRFLRDECGATFIQFIPIVERLHDNGVPFGAAVTDRSVTAHAVRAVPDRRL